MQQTFPIPGVQVCIMSGDGAQVNIDVKIGQDSRDKGLGMAAATTTVRPFAGQNGCFDVPWLVNGGYTAMIARSSTAATFGYCTANSKNAPNGATTATIGKCAQVAVFPDEGSTVDRVTINGSIVTGADNHAVQVCVAAFNPGVNNGNQPVALIANTVNAYNQSGAANLTTLNITNFRAGGELKITTYDITGPGPGGAGGLQFVCPTATAVQNQTIIASITTPAVPGATLIDSKIYRSLG